MFRLEIDAGPVEILQNDTAPAGAALDGDRSFARDLFAARWPLAMQAVVVGKTKTNGSVRTRR